MNEAREKLAFDVFLSHNSKDKPVVRALATLLAEHDIKVWLDEEQLIPGRPWQALLEKGIRTSYTGAVLVGSDGLGPWEDEEMRALLQFAVTQKKPVIPVLLPGAPKKPDLPLFLANRTWVDLCEGFGKEGIDKLIWGITGEHPNHRSAPAPPGKLVISVTRLRHGAEHLVGRENELARLDAAWHDPETHIVTIVAWGGVGKTALIVEWMARMARDGWAGAERVFDWSFYSQGTSETTTASADVFVAKALEFFGDPDMARSPASPWDKGERLAQLVAERKTLLVLDGVEPLQYPPGPIGGKLKEPAIEALLKGLAQHNTGLCIVTTRESAVDLVPFHEATAPIWLLDHLSEKAGAALLHQAGARRAGAVKIRKNDAELRTASREFKGHALTLRLLGGYLALAEEGDIRKRDRVEFEDADREFKTSPAEADKPYGHAFKVMAAYERWLASGGDDALRQLAILRLLGLFDRPLDVGCLAALRQEPAIPGLTDRLVGLSDTEWTVAVVRMEQCGLVSRTEQDNPSTSRGQVRIILPPPYESRRRVLDSHPLIREYFAQQLREKSPQAWREAHRRLYEHLRDSTPDLPEPTLDDLQPLYQAVAHGCRAELYEAAHRTFLTRISRGNEAYGTLVLGAAGADLAAVTWFFKEPWHRIVPGFPTDTQARLLNAAGFYLQTLGRLTEALGPLRAGLPMELQQNDWVNAAIRISNICAIELLLGEIALAAKHAEQAVELANRSGDETRRMLRHTTLAHVKHEMGLFEEAELLFRTAEQIQTGREPKYPILYSIQGYQYCDILLIIPERLAWQMVCSRGIRGEMKRKKSAPRAVLDVIHAVCQRASKTLDWVSPRNWTLDIALDHLTLGRAALYRAILETSKIQDSKSEIEQAVASLRRAGQQDELPRGLLTRAWFRLLEGDAAGARADLDEAWEIAERGSMRLHMADIHLHRARLFHDKDALAEARKLINQCGYHRRDEELADAEEAAKKW